jgi:two-component system, response regulator, stage 0 sporulation protein F
MLGKPLILCVDDALGVLEGRKSVLQQHGFEVLTATNGKEAFEVFISNPVHLVVLDYHMPIMNGGVAAAHMKASKPDVPIVLLSADDSVPQSTLKTVDAFVSKSQSITVFLETVNHLLGLGFLFQPIGGSETRSHGTNSRATSLKQKVSFLCARLTRGLNWRLAAKTTRHPPPCGAKS